MNPDSTITVDMGEPILDGPSVPTTLAPNAEFNSVVEQTHTDKNGKEWKISAVSMGNPHAIIYVDDLEKDVNFEVDGPALEGDTGAFPAKTNVEFCQGMCYILFNIVFWGMFTVSLTGILFVSDVTHPYQNEGLGTWRRSNSCLRNRNLRFGCSCYSCQ